MIAFPLRTILRILLLINGLLFLAKQSDLCFDVVFENMKTYLFGDNDLRYNYVS